jgi:hypothetical protein
MVELNAESDVVGSEVLVRDDAKARSNRFQQKYDWFLSIQSC